MRSLADDKYLLRLHNLNEERAEQIELSFDQIEEVTLTANQKKSDWQ